MLLLMGLFRRNLKARRDKAVRKALADPAVRAFLEPRSLEASHLAELRDRLDRSGIPEKGRCDSALRDVQLLQWYFSLPDPNKLTIEESLELMARVRGVE